MGLAVPACMDLEGGCQPGWRTLTTTDVRVTTVTVLSVFVAVIPEGHQAC